MIMTVPKGLGFLGDIEVNCTTQDVC